MKHPKWTIKHVATTKIHAVKIVEWEDHSEVCVVKGYFNWTDDTPSDQKKAAHLIAAAPELLESLKQAMAVLEFNAAELGRLDEFKQSEGYKNACEAIERAES